jgi:hypothetical protein
MVWTEHISAGRGSRSPRVKKFGDDQAGNPAALVPLRGSSLFLMPVLSPSWDRIGNVNPSEDRTALANRSSGTRSE